MIQHYSTSGSRKSGGVINKRKSFGSLDKKPSRALVTHEKCRLPQSTPKDWPEPSIFFANFRKFKDFSKGKDDLDFDDPPAYLTSHIERIFW